MNLSKNFTLTELTKTSYPYDNTPPENYIRTLMLLCVYILQPIRDVMGAILVSSGYRGPEVNKAVKSKPTSQHAIAEAADIQFPGYGGNRVHEVFRWIIFESGIKFGQCILEHKSSRGVWWIHISLPRPYRENQESFMIIDGVKKDYSPEEVEGFLSYE